MNVGVVGCGYWGPNLVRNLVETNRCESVWACDADAGALQKIKRRMPSVRLTSSFEELLNECDGVMVATPVASHHALVKRALEAGKGVFVEKPLSASTLEGEELIATAERHQQVLMVGHTFVYSPPVRKVKEYLEDGRLGDVYFLTSSRVNLGIHRSDVDVIWDLAPHDISMFLYWLNETPVRVSATGRACVGKLPDIATVSMEFPSGAIANLEVSWLAPSKLRRTVLVGSKSMVLYDDMAIEKVKFFDRGVALTSPATFGEFQLTYRSGDIVSPNLASTEPLLTQTNHFLDCLETGTRPATDGKMGLEIVRIIEAAGKSMRSRGEQIELKSSTPLVQAATYR